MLNEIDVDVEKKAEIVMHCVKSLAPDGNLVIIEPADKDNSTALRLLVSALMDKELGVYSPCSFIWGSRCKLGECWSFEEKEHIAPTALMAKVAGTEEAYKFMNTDIKYSHAILRKDTLTREKYRVPPKAKFSRLSQAEDAHRQADQRGRREDVRRPRGQDESHVQDLRRHDGTAGLRHIAQLQHRAGE